MARAEGRSCVALFTEDARGARAAGLRALSGAGARRADGHESVAREDGSRATRRGHQWRSFVTSKDKTTRRTARLLLNKILCVK